DHFYVRKSYHLHASRGDGVEARQKAGGKLREGEALIAVTQVVTPGQQITRVEIVIDLGNHAVHTVSERRSRGQIVARWTASFVIQARIRGIVEHWDVGGGPGVPHQQICYHRI